MNSASYLHLRAEAAMRDEDYRIARLHADQAAARPATPTNSRAYFAAEAWAMHCLEHRNAAHAAVIAAGKAV